MGLFLFDMDGTLIRSFMREQGGSKSPTYDNSMYDSVEVLPGVREKLDALRAEGHSIGIVTNQGGVAFGYQTREQVNRKLYSAMQALGFEPDGHRPETGKFFTAYVCFHHANATVEEYRDPDGCARRKPSGRMIEEAMWDFNVDPSKTVYVGDLPTDKIAAHQAGVGFEWASDFFGFEEISDGKLMEAGA